MAERVGFDPTVHCCITGFQDRLLKPLGHLSIYSKPIIAKTGQGCQIEVDSPPLQYETRPVIMNCGTVWRSQ